MTRVLWLFTYGFLSTRSSTGDANWQLLVMCQGKSVERTSVDGSGPSPYWGENQALQFGDKSVPSLLKIPSSTGFTNFFQNEFILVITPIKVALAKLFHYKVSTLPQEFLGVSPV